MGTEASVSQRCRGRYKIMGTDRRAKHDRGADKTKDEIPARRPE